jgi:hypothetical protein
VTHAPELLTPHTRGLIVHALKDCGQWHGKRGTVRLWFRLLEQPTLEGHRVGWRARINGHVHKGVAATVVDAEREIAGLE